MAKIEHVYLKWKESLRSPDNSIFYYHPSLERIILGLAVYVIGSRPLLNGLGKAEPLKILNIYATDLITAWIDENEEGFEIMFPMTIKVAECFMQCALAYENNYPAKKKNIRKLTNFFIDAVGSAGDMNSQFSESLLDDLSTDGKQIYSDKIKDYTSLLLRMDNSFDL